MPPTSVEGETGGSVPFGAAAAGGPRPPDSGSMVRRIAFAAVAIPVAIGVVWLGGWPLTLLVGIICILGVRELFDLAGRHEVRPLRRTGLVIAGAIPVLTYLSLSTSWWIAGVGPFVGAVALIAVLSIGLFRRSAADHPLSSMAVTIFGVVYAAALPSFLLVIRHTSYGFRSWAGTWVVFFPLAIIWICDSAAMTGGRIIGGPKLFPSVSPGKTWSGSAAGVAGALVTVPVFQKLALEPVGIVIPLWQGLLFAAVLSVLGQVGDLVESLFKREAGVKDSSALIPGHGGVLDRFDSLYFVIPLAAAMYRWIGV